MIRVPEIDALCEAIANKSALSIAGHLDAQRHGTLERRRCQIGGMLELACRLGDHRLVRFLEAHKDALGRQMECE